MRKYVSRQGMWFAVGVIVGGGAAIGLGDLAFRLGEALLGMVMIPVGGLVGGAIPGWSLRRGSRCIAAFAASYGAAIPFLLLGAIGIQGLSSGTGIFLVPVLGFVPFAGMGGLGVALAGLGERQALRSAFEFGIAGIVGSLVFLITISFLGWGSFVFLALPASVGGTLLTRRLASGDAGLSGASGSAGTISGRAPA
jgi:hypothetical protein